MDWLESWNQQVEWFTNYGADPAYRWAAFFPSLLIHLRDSGAARGLYAHRWATSLMVSRFALQDEAGVWEHVSLLPLPGERLEARAVATGGATLKVDVLPVPVPAEALRPLLEFAAGEASIT